jgi:hypothetical protein
MVSAIEPFLGRQFDQVAFVVEDLGKARESFGQLYGIKNWNTWNNLASGQINKRYYGQEGTFQFSCSYGFVGDVQVELCHHDSGPSIYKDWLDTRGPGFNHVAFRLDTRDEYNDAAAWFESQDAPLAMGGEVAGMGVWAYFDTVKKLGFFTEIYWSAPAVLEIFERMKRGEQVQLVR